LNSIKFWNTFRTSHNKAVSVRRQGG
jgi:hypothetical protein